MAVNCGDKMRKLVVFDVDGTLCDTKNGIIAALNFVYQDFGYAQIPKEEEDRYIGPSVYKSFCEIGGMNSAMAAEATKEYRRIYVDKYITESKLYGGVRETLSCLQERHVWLGIATMKTGMQLKRLLQYFELEKMFNWTFAAKEDGSLSKQTMLELIKMDAEQMEKSEIECYMVGDTLGDYKAAEKAGYHFVAAHYGYGNLHLEKLEYEVEQISEVTNVAIYEEQRRRV